MLTSFMMIFMSLLEVSMIAYFLNRPFVVCCIFHLLLSGLGKAALWILRIFLFGRAGNASLILRMLAAELVAWA